MLAAWLRVRVRVHPHVGRSSPARSSPPVAADADAQQRWWAHVAFLASDDLQGRDTGSEGHKKAAAYVAEQFKAAGLAPAGTSGYLQPVQFTSRKIVEAQSSLALVRDGKVEPVALGPDAAFSMRIDPAPQVEAPLVFVGYGLSIPELKIDDLAGLDLRGKVAVYLARQPGGACPDALQRARAVGRRAVGRAEAGRRDRRDRAAAPGPDRAAVGARHAGAPPAGDVAGRSRRSTTPPASRSSIALQPGQRRAAVRRLRAHVRRAWWRSPTTASRCRGFPLPSRRARQGDGRDRRPSTSDNVVGTLRRQRSGAARRVRRALRRTSITSASAARSTAIGSTTARWTTRPASPP